MNYSELWVTESKPKSRYSDLRFLPGLELFGWHRLDNGIQRLREKIIFSFTWIQFHWIELSKSWTRLDRYISNPLYYGSGTFESGLNCKYTHRWLILPLIFVEQTASSLDETWLLGNVHKALNSLKSRLWRPGGGGWRLILILRLSLSEWGDD